MTIVIANLKSSNLKSQGGGSGIRTHVGVTQTCFQDMRLQPLGHPSMGSDFHRRRKRFYHKKRVKDLTADGGVSTVGGNVVDIHHREHKVHGEKQRRISVFSVCSMVKNFFIYVMTAPGL